MGWFESQIEERRKLDEERLSDALQALSDAVTNRRETPGADMWAQTQDALASVLAYYGARPSEVPRDTVDVASIVDCALRSTGVMARPVRLAGPWWRDAMGAMLGFSTDGTPVALLPRANGGYSFHDPSDGEAHRVGTATVDRLEGAAWCFYRPLPQEELGIRDLLAFMVRSLDPADYLAVVGATLASTLLGMLVPRVNQMVFGPIVASGSASVVLPLAALLVGVMFSQVILNGAKSLVMARITTKLDLPLEAALMARVLSLPAPFFRKYSTGELSSRVGTVRTIAAMLQDMVLSTALTSVFSLVYLVQIWVIAPPLALPALAVILVSTLLSVAAALLGARVSRKTLGLGVRLSGWQYGLISGIQKLRLSGAESRAFSTWAEIYQEQARLLYNPPILLRLAAPLQTAVSLAGTLVIYLGAIAGGVTLAQYMAFVSAFGMVSGAFGMLSGVATRIAQIKPYLELAEPILKTKPEASERRPAAKRVSGSFELDNVTFSYGDGMPNVLENLSLKVRRGEYVAVVGRTGCGKSTLVRLLLGFETPQRGAVYYDAHDLAKTDAASVRRQIGVVLQDGKLFQGSILDNISISAPGLTEDEAWEAAELAGIADDIRAMPMGMRTMISEGQGGVSGGQRQRLMIARAIAAKPRILMFDEATSALDNVTQRTVSDSLEALRCTRLVIAHRLSTVRHCDRIVVLDGGRIAEDGTYEELMERGGMFSELVARQQV
ncbi:MAG: NHLP bacteriocin export ABC transporter permease/ATPase subunit [Atopobiaceae bacterium]|jgi:NHLM bacteriocin system ABC transporter ATP-binding protein|nr:NHLP bacteriocin export ABC transporter permease/ATPase subunit [Atopobiaceae bacterium]